MLAPVHLSEQIGIGNSEPLAHDVRPHAQTLFDVIDTPRELCDLIVSHGGREVRLELRTEGLVDLCADEVLHLHQAITLHRTEAWRESRLRFLIGEILQHNRGLGEYMHVVETQCRHITNRNERDENLSTRSLAGNAEELVDFELE